MQDDYSKDSRKKKDGEKKRPATTMPDCQKQKPTVQSALSEKETQSFKCPTMQTFGVAWHTGSEEVKPYNLDLLAQRG
jgi:hypothetical protein